MRLPQKLQPAAAAMNRAGIVAQGDSGRVRHAATRGRDHDRSRKRPPDQPDAFPHSATRSIGWRHSVDSSAPRAATIWPTTLGSRLAACCHPIRSRHSKLLLMKSSACPPSAKTRSVSAAMRRSANAAGGAPMARRSAPCARYCLANGGQTPQRRSPALKRGRTGVGWTGRSAASPVPRRRSRWRPVGRRETAPNTSLARAVSRGCCRRPSQCVYGP